MSLPVVVIARSATQRMRRGHPWVYDDEVVDVQGAQAGAVVRILGENGWSFGIGFFSDTSRITVRRVDHREVFLDYDFLSSRIAAAHQARQDVVSNQQAYRVINAEADGLPGLLIDRYGDSFVVQALCQGTDRLLDDIVNILHEQFGPDQVVLRNDHPARADEGLPLEVKVLDGPTEGLVSYTEGHLTCHANILAGDGTGAYLDQQHNRLWAQGFAHGRGLDLYCYSGGFAMHMAPTCSEVVAVDNSPQALTMAQLDGPANGLGNITWHGGDVLEFLEQANRSGDTWDTIVMDPPGDLSDDTRAQLLSQIFKVAQVRAYVLAFDRRMPMDRHKFEQELLDEAASSGRRAQLLSRRGPSWDHPTLATTPETEILTGILLRLV